MVWKRGLRPHQTLLTIAAALALKRQSFKRTCLHCGSEKEPDMCEGVAHT